MSCTRKNFLKTTGTSMLGLSLFPAFAPFEKYIGFPDPVLLPRMSPESQGISSEVISNFIKAANASGIGWHSFMLLRHGNVIAEGWWKPFAPQYKHTLYSLSKSFTSTAIGMLISEGRISVDDPVISFFKDELPTTVSNNLAKMKIRHLLTMNTGHEEDTMPKLRTTNGTWTKAFLEQPVAYEPGSHFLYNTGATYMLGAIVYKITGQKLETFLAPRLFQPLGINGYDWETSPQGLNTAGYGLRIKTEDIARFGQLYLQKGKWKEKQILPAAWIDEATRYQTSSQEGTGDWSQGYGYQFWRCKPGFYRGDGAFGQFCIVMPQYDAVMAINSESWDMQKSMTTVWENILPGMQANALPENPAALAALRRDLQQLSLPVPKGTIGHSAVDHKNYNGKKYRLDPNEYGTSGMQFKFSSAGCSWITRTGKGEQAIQLGWEKWVTNAGSPAYAFPAPGRIHVPSKIAGSANWIDQNTLQLNLRFVEAIHADKVTCVFNGDKLAVSFINSVSENTKNNAETRKGLTGSL